MSFNVKGSDQQHPTSRRIEPKDRVFLTPDAPPTYGELLKAEFDGKLLTTCEICGDKHSIKDNCRSKPMYAPSAFFQTCDICKGFHPKGKCHFEYLRQFLFTPTFCENCQLTHIGFCKEVLFCQFCNTRHNYADGCEKQISIDLSNNQCPLCGIYHTLHCPEELSRIKSDLVLYCNRCKIQHSFMNCVPYCNKCFRRHREGPCPEKFTFCRICDYCHQGDMCMFPTSQISDDKFDIDQLLNSDDNSFIENELAAATTQ